LTAAFFVAVWRASGGKNVRGLLSEVRPTIVTALIVSLIFFGFHVCVGQFMVRHSYAAIPPMVAALGLVATALAERLRARLCRPYAAACALVAIVALAHAIGEGPHVPGDWFD
jgi:hypothetical protein